MLSPKSEKSTARAGEKAGRDPETLRARKGSLGCGPLIMVTCMLALAAKFLPHGSNGPPPNSPKSAEVNKAEAKPKAAVAAAKAVIDRPGTVTPSRPANPSIGMATRNGAVRQNHTVVFNDPWDGSVWQVKRYLQRRLYDASSFEAMAWGPVTMTEKGFRVWCTYKARNVLGVLATQTKTFLLKKNGEVYAVKD